MNENLDLVKVLKDCPKGMELDCTMYENVTFVEVCKDTNTLYPIYCITTDENGNRSGCSFTKNGYASPRKSAKCVIFPKGKTTWKGFQRPFKDGDILYIDYNDDEEDTYKQYQYTFILKEIREGKIYCHCYIDECIDDVNINERFDTFSLTNKTYIPRFATEEEKQRLFKVLKDKGYKWNDGAKTLEKLIVPKFKVGDKIKEKNEIFPSTRIISYYNESIGYFTTINDCVRIEDQDDWELVPTHKFNIGDRIKHKHENFRGERTITSYEKHGYWTSINDCIHYKDEDDWELLVITPKFKVGDKIKLKGGDEIGIITQVSDGLYTINCKNSTHYWSIKKQDDWELLDTTSKFKVGDKIRHKTDRDYIFEISRVYNDSYGLVGSSWMIPMNYQNDYELVSDKFDPKTLQPFQKVLVRQYDDSAWSVDFYSYYDEDVSVCTGDVHYDYCIPYNDDTKHLLGKSDDAPEFYRYWEE